MKRIISLILILVCVFFAFSGCSDVQPQKVEKADATTTSEAQTKTETYKIGDSVKAGNLIFTVNSTRIDEGGEFIKPDEGKIYYIIDITVENTGDKSDC